MPEYVEAKEKLDKLAERWTKEIEERYAALKTKKTAGVVNTSGAVSGFGGGNLTFDNAANYEFNGTLGFDILHCST